MILNINYLKLIFICYLLFEFWNLIEEKEEQEAPSSNRALTS